MIKKKNKLAAAAVALMLAAQVAGCGEKEAPDTTGSGAEKTETENSVSEPVQMEDAAGQEAGNDSGPEEDIDAKNEPEYEDYEIEWKDSAVEKAVRDKLQIQSGSIMLSDILGITELDSWQVQDVVNFGVRDLSDLAAMKNLEVLKLFSDDRYSAFSFSDGFEVSITGGASVLNTDDFGVIAELPKLQELDLGMAYINDISGLPAMPNLTSFKAGGAFEDISVLSKYPNLTELVLMGAFRDISVLSQLNKLETLVLDITNSKDIYEYYSYEEISSSSVDLSALAGLSNLKNLLIINQAVNCELTGFDALKNLESLESLTIRCNSDYSGSEPFRLEVISGLSNLGTLSLFGINAEGFEPLADMQGLKRLALSRQYVEKLPALPQVESFSCTDLTKLTLPDMENLQTLSIGISIMQEEDANLEALADLPKLQSLSLYIWNGNTIILPDMSELETLNIGGSGTVQGAPSSLPKLKSLSIGSAISYDESLDMPNLEDVVIE